MFDVRFDAFFQLEGETEDKAFFDQLPLVIPHSQLGRITTRSKQTRKKLWCHQQKGNNHLPTQNHFLLNRF